MKICYITTIIGDDNYNREIPGKFKTFPEFDYYLFTNLDPNKYFLKNNKVLTSWNIIKISNEYLDAKIKNVKKNREIYKSRYMKFMGWEYLKNVMKKDYDIICYCDSGYNPGFYIEKNKWMSIFKIAEKHGLVQKYHPTTHNIYDECLSIIKNRKDSRYNIEKSIKFFKGKKMPPIKFTENTAFIYHTGNKYVLDVFEKFWNLYTNTDISYRDQPLWGYIMWDNKLKFYDEQLLFYNSTCRRNLYFCVSQWKKPHCYL